MRVVRWGARLLPPALALSLVFFWQTGAIDRQWAMLCGGPPIADYPAVLDLGTRSPNEVVSTRFELVNAGGQELVVDQLRTSCSCGALQRVVGDRSEVFEELRLAPRERIPLVITTTVRADAAGTYQQSVVFRTNDQNQPEGRITVVFRTTSGSLRAYPSSVQFGSLIVERQTCQNVEIVDRDGAGQTIANVVSADPTRVIARWIPAEPGGEAHTNGVVVGRVELVPNTAHPARLDTTITIEFTDPKIQSLSVPVMGRVTPLVEVVPESLALPLASGGAPVYSANCQVRGPDDQPLDLEIENVPPGLKVEFPGQSKSLVRAVRVTWMPAADQGPGTTRKIVRLRVTTSGKSHIVELPVTCERQ